MESEILYKRLFESKNLIITSSPYLGCLIIDYDPWEISIYANGTSFFNRDTQAVLNFEIDYSYFARNPDIYDEMEQNKALDEQIIIDKINKLFEKRAFI